MVAHDLVLANMCQDWSLRNILAAAWALFQVLSWTIIFHSYLYIYWFWFVQTHSSVYIFVSSYWPVRFFFIYLFFFVIASATKTITSMMSVRNKSDALRVWLITFLCVYKITTVKLILIQTGALNRTISDWLTWVTWLEDVKMSQLTFSSDLD